VNFKITKDTFGIVCRGPDTMICAWMADALSCWIHDSMQQ